jgi:Na+/proline symporter
MNNDLVFYLSVSLVVLVLYAYLIRVALSSGREIVGVDEYFFGRNLTSGSVFSTLYAAEMSVATVFIAFFELAPILGVKLFAAILTFCAGQLLLLWLLPRIKAASQSRYTLPTVLSRGFESGYVRLVAMCVLALGFAGLFATEVIVGAQLLKFVSSEVDLHTAGIFFISVIVVAYAVVGGYRNVVKIDKIQTACLLVVVLFLGWCAWWAGGPTVIWRTADVGSFIPPWPFIVNLLVINAAYPIVDMAAWHRIAAAKSADEGRRGFSLGVLFFLVTWSIVLLAAIGLTATTGKSGAEALVMSFKLAAQNSTFLAVAAGASLGILIAALLSTGDAFLICAAQAVYFDFRRDERGIVQTHAPSQEGEVAELALARRTVLVLAVSSILLIATLKILGANVADLVFIVYGSSTALLPSVLTVLFSKAGPMPQWSAAAIISIVVGVFMGWFYGFLCVASNETATRLARMLDVFRGEPSPYNAASTALTWSVATFVLVAVCSDLNRRVTRRARTA